jgi:hypothetical protein
MKRQILIDCLNPVPPESLFHYTTQTGLLGIIKNKEIWATHTQYLNDRREFLHALSLVKEEIAKMLGDAKEVRTRELLTEMEQGVYGREAINICVCSFSADKDSLPQWRGYGASSSGYAVGFNGSFLGEIAHGNNFYLVRCIYDEASQRAIIRALLEEVLEENIERDRVRQDAFLPDGGNLCAYLNRFAPVFKDSSFESEREWRLISPPLGCKFERFDFRAGHSMVVPYFRLPLFANDLLFQVHEVVIGPTPHPDQSVLSVQSLLVSERLSGGGVVTQKVPVIVSRIPYRNW